MELIRGLCNLRPSPDGCVATIGNFDGMHRGHQAVIRQVVDEARSRGRPAVLVTFEPLPHEYFGGRGRVPRLSRLRDKLAVLRGLGLDRVVCLHFDARLAAMPADGFIRRVLVEGLGLRHLVIGDDFRFGRDRAGDFALLERAGRAHGFSVERTRTYRLDGERVSSTRVRRALEAGELALAEHLLGRPFRVSGRVFHGDRRGRELGFPTANLALPGGSPLRGVFAVRVSGAGLAERPAVANVGRRPTVGGERLQLEVHLLDFQGALYGRLLEVAFCRRLRDERRFDGLAALRDQIHDDVAAARRFFAEAGAPETPSPMPSIPGVTDRG